MGKRFDETEQHFGVEIEFRYDGQDYIWKGDYEVRNWGEESDHDYIGDSEFEVELLDTDSLIKWDELQEMWVDVEMTRSIQAKIELEIERGL